MRDTISICIGVALGLLVAMVAYQFVPAPPEKALAITCYGDGKASRMEADVALVMSGQPVGEQPYADITVKPKGGGEMQTIRGPRLFCGFTIG